MQITPNYLIEAVYALLTGKPWRDLAEVYAEHFESSGTKAYSRTLATTMFSDFTSVIIAAQPNHGQPL